MDVNDLNIDASAKANVQAWLDGIYDKETKQAVRDLMSNPNELNESFYRNLEFGTGGLRGIMGVGTNRMNTYTVAMATQGLVNYIRKCYPNEHSLRAVVSYDSRNNSREFAEITAKVFAANAFHVYLFKDIRPTPELSFAVRYFRCQTGVMITASHNPKEYNGYKAYWCDGCQLTPPHDVNVIDEVKKIRDIREVSSVGEEANIEKISFEADLPFLECVKDNTINPDCIKRHGDIKIVYTPLHGTGIRLIPRVLSELGFSNVNVVEQQAEPDGNFPTTPSPNPEEHAAMSMAVDLAKKIDADIVFASDPDADRVGVAVKRPDGEWMLLNGNQTLSVILYYILSQRHDSFKGNEYIIKTIVTSELPAAIAASYDVRCFDVLTGFKWIGAKIESIGRDGVFVAGGEESYGYMIGSFVRDKDAVSACSMIAEIAAWAADQGKSFYDVLVDIYLKYGFYKEGLLSVVRKGKSGAAEIEQMMKDYRENPPKTINGSPVVRISDYLLQRSTDLVSGAVDTLTLPVSNVLQFFTADGNKVTVRPSGTEPKIKYYFGVKGELSSAAAFDEVNDALDAKIKAIQADLNLL